MINHKLDREEVLQEILCRLKDGLMTDQLLIIESVDSQYINISTFRPLQGVLALNYLLN